MPYLNAVFHEALRRHSPVPIIPLRYATEDTQLGGFNIQAGSEVSIWLTLDYEFALFGLSTTTISTMSPVIWVGLVDFYHC